MNRKSKLGLFHGCKSLLKFAAVLGSHVLILPTTNTGQAASITGQAASMIVSQEITSAVGVGRFSYDSADVFDIPIGTFGTASIVAVNSFHSFYFKSSLSGVVYTLNDLVDNGAFFSPAFPVITGQPLPRIPRFGIFEAAIFTSPSSTVLELFFDVVRDSAHGTPGGQSPYSITQPVPALTVAVDVKPGSAENPLNPRSNGVIPVAILSTSNFDARTVDQGSLKFGPGQGFSDRRGQFQDANGDGLIDLVLHFRTEDAGIQCDERTVSIMGQTIDGIPIWGSDSITTVGCTASYNQK